MKKIILRSLPWLIAAALIAVLVIFVGIPLFAEETSEHLYAPTIYYYEGDTAPVTMENEYLSFELDPTTTQFKVTDKATGREWLSNPADAANDPLAVAANKETLQSTAIVTYTTSSGSVDLNNFKYSIQGGNYNITKQDDGSVRVDYAVGKIEKTYCIPSAITKERFDQFTEAMSKSTAKKVKSNYSLYEPSKLDSKENKDEIIALYPSVTEQALYILKSSTNEANKSKLEGYFAEANYTQEDYELDLQLVAGSKDNSGPVFNIAMIYRLEGKDFVAELPFESIRYKEGYAITYVTPLPQFGAASLEDEGYMFVPEGGGAIIRFNNGKTLQNSYYANLYGWDYATNRKELINETRNTYPVFGMVKNGGSFLCFMEGATSFGGIQADISQRFTSYNSMSAKYNVLHADQYNVSAKTAQLVYMFESAIPEATITHRYRFYETDDYAALANSYGDYLRETHPELAQAKSSEDVPVSVELVGAIDKTVEKLGLPIDSVFATTTFSQASDILQEMSGKGIGNLNVRFSGWANGGVNQKVFTRVNILRELGGKGAMQKLIANAKELGVSLYFDGVNCFSYDSGIFDGFISFSNAARYATREQIELHPFDIVDYSTMDWMDSYYLVRPDYAKANTTNMLKALADVEAAGVSFRDIGSFLSADYNPKDTVTREEVKAMNIDSMKEAQGLGQKIMIKQGNDYALPYADMITDMDLSGTKYGIIDESIPFYQIALHGMKDYTGDSVNTTGDYVDEFLKCVEYGAGLNYTFFAADGKVLQDTTHSNFYGSSYASWAEEFAEDVVAYQAAAAGLNQQRIVSHQRLDNDVALTCYEDGTKVYVNYADTSCTIDGTFIDARDYTVERGQ